ncbi:MAG: lysoplasmalogenase [Clostridia bacterium]|nr:lysoplasmalogenase [Clostridia bacterium]
MNKKQFITLITVNSILFVSMVITDILYMLNGGLGLKSLASSVFVLTSLINLILMFVYKKTASKGFIIILFIGQIFAMLGDILLEINFMLGAIFFAIGHIFYFISYCFIKKFCWKDLLFIGGAILISLSVILLSKIDLGSMAPLIFGYAIVISCMLGKSATLILQDKKIGFYIFIGSLMFYLSDMFLMFRLFGGMGKIGSVLCLAFYYPAEFVLATSIAIVGCKKQQENSN